MSACSSGYFNPSYVLLSIGLNKEDAMSSLRVTFGKDNTFEEIDELIDNLKRIVR
jgi:cysteine desulfurase